MMKSLPRPWYLTKWRRSRDEAAGEDRGAETAETTTRRRAGAARSGRQMPRAREGAVRSATEKEVAAKAACEVVAVAVWEVVAAASGDRATATGARGVGNWNGAGPPDNVHLQGDF